VRRPSRLIFFDYYAIYQVLMLFKAFIIQSGDRRQFKTSMARSRSNDLSVIVNRFFYEDSPSTINYTFKRVDEIYSTGRTAHLSELIKYNQTNASKLIDRLKFMNDEMVSSPSNYLNRYDQTLLTLCTEGRVPEPRYRRNFQISFQQRTIIEAGTHGRS
jgi:hypothetical protein